MRVRLLGPVDVVTDGVPRPVSGLRRKAVLAVLALHLGEVVSSDRLADVLWGDAPPATAQNTLQRHVSHLRGVLGSRAAIVGRRPGYLLDPVQVETDVAVAERLIRSGSPAADRAREQRLREALALWRGPALFDVDGLPWLDEQAERLERLRLDGNRALVQARLALGEHAAVLPELEALTREHPFDEGLHAQLVLALYRCGRQTDALAVCHRLREKLRDQLAIEPGRELRDLVEAILRQDRSLDLAAAADVAAGAARPKARPEPETSQPEVARPAPLLEREAPLAALAGFAAEARAGAGRVVLLGGEAGVGKSALVERLRQELPDARWYWGACDGLFTPRPLGPLFDLADQLGGALLDQCAAGADREELFRTLRRQLSAPGGLHVVVVEDIHWADEATLDLLLYLSRRLRDAPVLLIATYRDDGMAASDPVRIALGDLAAQRGTRRVRLGPLSERAVAALSAGSGLAAAELYRLTGGNPFHVIEVLQAGTAEVPLSARDAVLARAARLSDGPRELLDVAALAGTRVEVQVLRAVTGCPPAALDELLASGLLAPDGGWVRFRHEIARLAVAQAVAAHRGQALHERILAALEAAGEADDARLAFHAEAAGDDALVLRHATAAARRAARLGAHREAAAQYERALRFAGRADRATLAALREGLAEEAGLLDRWEDAARAQERALVLWRELGDLQREGGALWRLSRICWNQYRGREALEASEAAVRVLEGLGPGLDLARAYATYAGQRMLSDEYDEATSLAARAQELAAHFGAMDVYSDALNTQAVSLGARGRPWAAQMRRALDIALSGGHHAQAARAYCNLSEGHVVRREFAAAEPVLIEGIAYCDEHDITAYGRCLRGELSSLLEHSGRWDEAVKLCADLLPQVERSPVNRLSVLRRLAVLRARRGEPGVWDYLNESMDIAADAGEPRLVASTRLARAEAYWLNGATDDARREAELGYAACEKAGAWERGAAVAWLLRTGSALRVSGEVAGPYRLLLAGDATAAAAAWTGLGSPYDAALAAYDAADAATLSEARRIADGLGAEPLTRLVSQRLRDVGAGQATARRAASFGVARPA